MADVACSATPLRSPRKLRRVVFGVGLGILMVPDLPRAGAVLAEKSRVPCAGRGGFFGFVSLWQPARRRSQGACDLLREAGHNVRSRIAAPPPDPPIQDQDPVYSTRSLGTAPLPAHGRSALGHGGPDVGSRAAARHRGMKSHEL